MNPLSSLITPPDASVIRQRLGRKSGVKLHTENTLRPARTIKAIKKECAKLHPLAGLIDTPDTKAIRERMMNQCRVMNKVAVDDDPVRDLSLTADEQFLEAFNSMPERFKEWQLVDSCPLRQTGIRRRLYNLLKAGLIRRLPSNRATETVFQKVRR